MYILKLSNILLSLNFDKAVQLICLILSLESLSTLPISSKDWGVSPFRPKYSFRIFASLSHNTLWRIFSRSCFIICLFTISSGVVSSCPDMISYKNQNLNCMSFYLSSIRRLFVCNFKSNSISISLIRSSISIKSTFSSQFCLQQSSRIRIDAIGNEGKNI